MYLEGKIDLFLRAADWRTTNFLGMHCYFPISIALLFSDQSTVSKWPQLQQSHCKWVEFRKNLRASFFSRDEASCP